MDGFCWLDMSLREPEPKEAMANSHVLKPSVLVPQPPSMHVINDAPKHPYASQSSCFINRHQSLRVLLIGSTKILRTEDWDQYFSKNPHTSSIVSSQMRRYSSIYSAEMLYAITLRSCGDLLIWTKSKKTHNVPLANENTRVICASFHDAKKISTHPGMC
jgi:hypothetical protein